MSNPLWTSAETNARGVTLLEGLMNTAYPAPAVKAFVVNAVQMGSTPPAVEEQGRDSNVFTGLSRECQRPLVQEVPNGISP